MPTLTPEQQKSYYETQGNAANPLSPLAYLESLNTASGKTHEPTILSTMNAGKVESKINTIANTGTEASTKRDEIVGSRPEPTPPDLLEDETPEDKIIRLKEEAFKKSQEAYDNFTIANTEEASADVADLKRQWEKMYKTQEEINRSQQGTYSQALLRTGTSRYTPETGADVMADVQNKGLEKLGEINAKYESAIAKTKAAMKSKNYELAYKAGQEAQDYYDKSLTEIRKQRDEVAKMAKEKADEEKTIREEEKYNQEQEQVKSETLANALIGTGEDITPDMLNLIAETNDISPLSLQSAMVVSKSKYAKEKATVGDLGQFNDFADQFKVEKTIENFYDFIAKKGAAGRKPETGGDGISGGEVSGVVSRDTDSVMSGVLNLQDISTKDNYRASVSAELKKKYDESLKTGDIFGAMRASAVYDKEPSDTFLTSMEKTVTTLSQIGVLQENINKEKTGPIVGAFRSANPWDTKAQVIKSQLNAIVPNLARGVYGEVGVLTDNDIKVYAKTLPTLTSTEDIRNAILYITVDQIRKNVEIKIKNQAAGQRDMSGYADIYKNLEAESQRILGTIKGAKKQEQKTDTKTVLVNGKPVVYKKSGDKWIKQ